MSPRNLREVASLSLMKSHPHLAAEWHPTKNGEVTPDKVHAGAHLRVWWKCSEAHEWPAPVKGRANRSSRCPYCAGKKTWSGFNDLATKYPQIASEWHPTKNGITLPNNCQPSSTKTVWWLCSQGHDYLVSVNSRVKNNAWCPTCRRETQKKGEGQVKSRARSKERKDYRERSLARVDVSLAKQWHPARNGEITPANVTGSSPQVFWWQCPRRHEWQESVDRRRTPRRTVVAGEEVAVGCPYCDGKRLLVGENDFASLYPEVAAEWHPTLNPDLRPEGLLPGRKVVIYWLCAQCEHVWNTPLWRRTTAKRPTGCAVCSEKLIVSGKNDLRTKNPYLVEEWHPTENGELDPSQIAPSSYVKVRWQCRECEHAWSASVGNRHRLGRGCPSCAGLVIIKGINDFATKHPHLVKDWHPTKNKRTPQESFSSPKEPIWWQCDQKHKWSAPAAHRINGQGCPYCSGRYAILGETDLAHTHPELAAEWHPLRNNITPQEVKSGTSSLQVWWQCKLGHEWQKTPLGNTQFAERALEMGAVDLSGCRACRGSISGSLGEGEVASFLESLGVRVVRNTKQVISPKELDIYLPDHDLAVEYNGLYYHSDAFARTASQMYHHSKWDASREKGITLIHVWEDQWLYKPEQVKHILSLPLRTKNLSTQQELQVEGVIAEVTRGEAEAFFEKYSLQDFPVYSHLFALRAKTDRGILAVLLIEMSEEIANITGYATRGLVAEEFSQLLDHVSSTSLKPREFRAYSDHGTSDNIVYERNGFTAGYELEPTYTYKVGKSRKSPGDYTETRFQTDPSLKWEPGLSRFELARLNGFYRIWDAGKTQWVRSC